MRDKGSHTDWLSLRHAGYRTAQLLVLGAALSCVGWLLNIDTLIRLSPNFPAIHPLTATCYLLLGITLVLSLRSQAPGSASRSTSMPALLASGTAAIVGITAATQLVLRLTDAPVALDQWIFPAHTSEVAGKLSRMSIPTALVLTLVSFGFLFSRTGFLSLKTLAQAATLLAAFLVGLSLIGRLLGMSYFDNYFTSFATSTLTLLAVFAVMTLALADEQGWINLARSPSITRTLLIWLIPLGLLLPMAFVFLEFVLYNHLALAHDNVLYIQSTFLMLTMLLGVLTAGKQTQRAESRAISASQALQESRNDLNITLRSIGEAVIAVNLEQRVKMMNRMAERLTGWTANTAVGRPISEVLRITDGSSGKPIDFAARDDTTSSNQTDAANHLLRNTDGQDIVVEHTVSPIHDDDGITTGSIIVIRDISARYTTQLALEKESWRLNSVIRGTNAGTWSWNVQTGEVTLDERWAAIAGYTLDELQPIDINTWIHMTHPDDQVINRGLLLRHFEGKDAYFENESRIRHKDGHWVWARDAGKVFSWTDDGEPLWMFGTHYDISKRKIIEAELRSLNEELESRVERRALELRESEARFRLALNNSAIGMAVVSLEGRWLEVNASLCEILGYDTDELLQRTFQDITYPEDLGADLLNVNRLVAGEIDNYQMEKRYVHKNGHLVWTLLTASLARSDDGAPLLFILQIQDITSRKWLEQARETVTTWLPAYEGDRYNQEALIALSEILDIDTLLIGQPRSNDPTMIDTLAVLINGRLTDNFAYPIDGTPCQQIYDEGQCVVTDNAQSLYPNIGHRLGQDIVAYIGTVLSNVNGQQIGHIAVMTRTPITDPVAISECLRPFALAVSSQITRERDRKRYRNLFELAPDAFLMVDRHGTIVKANRQAENQFGWSQKELIGNKIEMLVPAECKQDHIGKRDEYIAAPIARAMSRSDPHIFAVRKDKTQFPIDISLSPIETEEGIVVAAAIRDITQRVAAEDEIKALNADLEARVEQRTDDLIIANIDLERAREEAENASRAKSSFLAAMSHEIRTPMNGVIGMLDILTHSKLDEQQHDAVKTIRESGLSLLHLIDDILDFSKIEAGRLDLEQVPISLNNKVEGICTSLASVARKKNVDLTLFIDPKIPARVNSDPTRLRQILYNLIGNAIKFSGDLPDRRGRVSVRVNLSPSKGEFEFTIADNGIGMTRETKNRIFDAFSQAETSTTRRFGGTGLGLPITKHLVNMMHGKITVKSRLHQGSDFKVVLPLKIADTTPEQPAEELDNIHCVVIENPHNHANDLGAYLEHAGAQLSIASNRLEAIALSKKLPKPVVVIHDAHHLVMDTAQLLSDFAHAGDVRHVVLGQGHRQHACDENDNIVTLNSDVLRRKVFVRAVAIAAGRASPEIAQTPIEQNGHIIADITPTASEARRQNRLVLVAEDDSINQKVILKQLGLLGLAGEVAGNGKEALKLWRKGGYALVLTDLHMPKMDGYELTEIIRREEKDGHRIPILALTANALRGETTRATAAGMDDYLTKPIELKVLGEALNKWLSIDEPEPEVPIYSVPEATAEKPNKVIDLKMLESVVGNDAMYQMEFLNEYLASARDHTDQIKAALTERDIQLMGQLAHKLKSSSRIVGALTFGDACADLENACKTGESLAIDSTIAAFENNYNKVENEIALILEQGRKKRNQEISGVDATG